MRANPYIKLVHVGFCTTGTATLDYWGGGQGEVVMDERTVYTESAEFPKEEAAKHINDAQYGCEAISEARVEVYALYDDDVITKPVRQYFCTYYFEKNEIPINSKRGI